MPTRRDAQMSFVMEKLKREETGTWSGSTRTLGTSTIAYPIYDGHGNRVCTLSRYGSGSWTTDSPRFVDAWGTMRTGTATGASPMRYCASLGHLQDDESGLVYMRARFYEPASGRFCSQDLERQAANWFTYCANDPIDMSDESGQFFDLGSGTIEEIIEKVREMQIYNAARSAALNTVEKIVASYNATILQWLAGGGTFIAKATADGIEVYGEDGYSIFLDLSSKEAVMNGAHVDFQYALESLVRIFESGDMTGADEGAYQLFEAGLYRNGW